MTDFRMIEARMLLLQASNLITDLCTHFGGDPSGQSEKLHESIDAWCKNTTPTPVDIVGLDRLTAIAALPQFCRERLRLTGKAYPKSGCRTCGNGGMMGCPHKKADIDYEERAAV